MPGFMTWPSIWPKPACRAPAGALWDQDSGRPHDLGDEVAGANEELLDAAVDDLGNLALRDLHRGLLLRTVEPEEDIPLLAISGSSSSAHQISNISPS